MGQIKSKKALIGHYGDKKNATSYIKTRFEHPLGQVLHNRQVSFVNLVIKEYKVRDLLEIAPGPARISVDIKGFEKGLMVDSSENMLDLAKRRLSKGSNFNKWSFQQANIFNFKSNRLFDLVYTFRFIRHLDKEKRYRIYLLINSVLKDKGLLIFDAVNYDISFPLRQQNPNAYNIYDKLYNKNELINELGKNGFRVIKLRSVQCQFQLQYFLNKFRKFKISPIVKLVINLLENDNAENPLEWVVLCQKK